jgi:hypothetical protein
MVIQGTKQAQGGHGRILPTFFLAVSVRRATEAPNWPTVAWVDFTSFVEEAVQ